MKRRKGEEGGTISAMRKLILFVVITLILVGFYVLLKDKSIGLFDPIFNFDFSSGP